MTNTLLKRYSMRPVGVVGAMLFSFPNVCLAFVRNVYEMALINFLQGLGLGLIFTICNTNFNAYFVKRRAPVRKGGGFCLSDKTRILNFFFFFFLDKILLPRCCR